LGVAEQMKMKALWSRDKKRLARKKGHLSHKIHFKNTKER